MSQTADHRKHRRPRDERKDQILRTAAQLFAQKGYDRTSLRDIIDITGGSRRDIYDFFGGKSGLFDAVFRDLMMGVLDGGCFPDEIDPAEMGADRDIRADLIHIARGFLNAMLDPAFMSAFRQFIPLAADSKGLGHAAHASGPLAFHARLQRYLQRQVDLGVLDIEDTHVAAQALNGMIKGDFQTRALLTGEDHVDPDTVERHIHLTIDMFLQGVLKR